MKTLYCFDLDGTLIDWNPKDYHAVVWLPNRLPVIKELIERGKQIALVTNQGGVAWNYHTPMDFERKVRALCNDIGHQIYVEVCYGDPRKPSKYAHENRKPSPTMIFRAMAKFAVYPSSTIFIGDMETDRLAAEAAGVEYLDAKEFFGE